jgi:hypothetical protein
MAWENRKQSRYYYTGHRVDGQYRKVYHGRGEAAVQAAREAATARAARQADQEAATALQRTLEPLDHQGDELDRQVDLLVEASLTVAGLHQHHGQWRRWHGCQQTNPTK